MDALRTSVEICDNVQDARMQHAEFEARVGTLLRDKWTLEKLLGVGGMAAVYMARHKIGRTAAIKLLHPEIAVDDQVRARFEQEAMAVNSIGHPGVVEIRDIDVTEDGAHYLVMELLEGETLADRFERDANIKLSWLLDVVAQLLDVLVACHGKGIVHRDIKPENLFIQKDGQLKVLDFGIARMKDGLRTQAGTMLGTVAFSPPEQLKGGEVDARADLFAVGATLFTVIAKRRIHEVADNASLVLKMMREPAPPLGSVAPTAPANVCMLVDRALAYLPEHRYPDALTMRGDTWAVQKGQRPPYAYACEQAGMDPHLTSQDRPTKGDAPPLASDAGAQPASARALPPTSPQLPAFLERPAASVRDVPSTEPQLPTFADPASPAPPADGALASASKPEDEAAADDEAADAAAQDPTRQKTLKGIQRVRHWRTDPKWPAAKKRGQTADAPEEESPDQGSDDD